MTSIVEAVLSQSHRELVELGVIKEGHFERHDGKHTRWYFHSHPLFWTGALWRIVQDLVAIVPDEILKGVDAIAGPQFAGNLLGQGMVNIVEARGARDRKPVNCVPIERGYEKMGKDIGREIYQIRRYYREQLPDLKVLLVDDVVASGVTRVKCIRLLEGAGAEVVGGVCIADLSLVPGVSQHSLWKPPTADIYDRAYCPHCRAGVLMTRF